MSTAPLPSSAPPTTPLLTARLTLRPYQQADKEAFFALIDENRARLQPAFPSRVAAVQALQDASAVLAQFHHDWRVGRLYVLGIWHTATGRYLGDISLRPAWGPSVSAEIGYYLAADAEGRGYAREALAAAVQFGFGEHMRAALLTIRCQRTNPRSMAVAEAVGFRPATTRRRLWPLRNETPDIVHFRLERSTAAETSPG
jgi:RimJ/RimL family protein N-acetyltransferase